jgi:tellurite resistance protein TerC
MLTSARPVDWAVFAGSLLVTMALSRLFFGKTEERMQFREALARSLVWIAVGLAFGGYVYASLGHQDAVDYLVAYLVEESLSVDNLFVFLVVFSYFKANDRQQQRVLTWGILGAVVMRGLFIVTGTAVLGRFHWAYYVFGAFLLYSGVRLVFGRHETVDPEKSWTMRLSRRYLRTTDDYHDYHFFVRQGHRRFGTRLLLVLVMIESTDLLFAVDSVPAVLGISRDLFVVYTSNILAVLCLRALYFVLAGMLRKFRYLDTAVSVILAFVGLKMLTTDLYKLSNLVSLGVIGGLLTLAIAASVLHKQDGRDDQSAPG